MLFLYQKNPYPRVGVGFLQRAAERRPAQKMSEARGHIKRKLRAAGYKVITRGVYGITGTDGYSDERLAHRLKLRDRDGDMINDLIRTLSQDKCFKGFVWLGHSDGRGLDGGRYPMTGRSLSDKGVSGLDFVAIFGCKCTGLGFERIKASSGWLLESSKSVGSSAHWYVGPVIEEVLRDHPTREFESLRRQLELFDRLIAAEVWKRENPR